MTGQTDRPDGIDKGMVAITQPSPHFHQRWMGRVFRDLPEAACAAMGYEAAPMPQVSAQVPRRERFDRYDYHYRQDKRFTRGRGR